MNHKVLALSGALLSALVAAAPAEGANYVFKTKRCATVELTQQASPEPGWEIYTFVETGELRPAISLPANVPFPAFSSMKYVCKGHLAKDKILLTTGTLLARNAWASCVFAAASGAKVLAQASSSGMGTPANPPKPPVNFKIIEGTGAFAGIVGTGVGDGYLPSSDHAGGEETCSTIRWKVSLPPQVKGH